MRKVLVLVAAVVILSAVNFTVYQREKLLTGGRPILLELAPVDPRSLMQGDYMALRFRVAADAFASDLSMKPRDGHLVVVLDERGVAAFRRFADGAPLRANEALLRYRIRNGQPKFATNAFFFQEGHARFYEKARYGEFRSDKDGEILLTSLLADDFTRLGPPREEAR